MNTRQEFFNKLSEDWDKKFSTPQLLSFLGDFVPKFGLRKGQRILDAGTGTGILIPFLLKEVGRTGSIVAIDYVQKMTDICRDKYADTPNLQIETKNIEKLNFPAESFDAVVCFGMFPHIENKQNALIQIKKVLKPNGSLIIAHALSSEEIKNHHRNTTSVISNDYLPKKEEMENMLTNAGFVKVQISDSQGHYLCRSIKKGQN